MEREIFFEAAYDSRDTHKGGGIHGVDIRFILKGEKGVTQFVLYTNWFLPHVQADLNARYHEPGRWPHEVSPADLGYHSRTPLHDYQKEPSQEHCQYLDGPCYYDGSALNAVPVFERLLREGSDGVWAELEDYYKATFGEAE